jgi:hypothetical protein
MFAHNAGDPPASAESLSGSRAPKRKRKIFSCHYCRQKKLRCDRLYPACGRCQESGHAATCGYEPSSFDPEYATPLPTGTESGGDNIDFFQNPTIDDHSISYGVQYIFPPFIAEDVAALETGSRGGISRLERTESQGHSTDERRRHKQATLSSLTLLSQRQAARIASLENDLGRAGSKNTRMNSQDWVDSAAPNSRPRKPYVEETLNTFSASRTVTTPAHEEHALYRGKGFDARYYGPSNPLSIVATSPSILKNVS